MERAVADNRVLDADNTEGASRMAFTSLPSLQSRPERWMKNHVISSQRVGSEFKLYQVAVVPSLRAGEEITSRYTETFETISTLNKLHTIFKNRKE